MKFIIGFFFGLMTGVTIVIAPLIAVLVALGFMAQKDEDKNVTIVNNLDKDISETDLSATAEGGPNHDPSETPEYRRGLPSS